MWASNVKQQQTNSKQKPTTTLIYLTHTRTTIHMHTYIFLNNNLDSDRHSFIYMNIQYIYNTKLVQKDKKYIHTCTRYKSNL